MADLGVQARTISNGTSDLREDAILEIAALRGLAYGAPSAAPTTVRTVKETISVSLIDEIAPLINVLNSRFYAGAPLVQLETDAPAPRDFPRGARTRIDPAQVELPLDLYDMRPPIGAKRQSLWTLLTLAGLGQTWRGNSRRATVPERRRGTFWAPLSFRLIAETHAFHNAAPVWENHRLVISCEETDRVEAIQAQVKLLSDRLADPGNLLPLSHSSMHI